MSKEIEIVNANFHDMVELAEKNSRKINQLVNEKQVLFATIRELVKEVKGFNIRQKTAESQELWVNICQIWVSMKDNLNLDVILGDELIDN